ncbi:MAG: AAA family ATPase [Novosphingobium sp.]|nr:AAA family ATPase [Novosphingobium sp.]
MASADLAARAEEVAKALFGEPNKQLSSKDELRFGTNGSLRVSIAGEHRGTWRDHESGAGGGVLDLIVHKHGGDRKTAAAWLRDNFEASQPANDPGKIEAVYRYEDWAGELVHEVVRYAPKNFRQRRPDGKGGHLWNMKGVAPTLYNLPRVHDAATKGELVIVVEGEKDADRLNGLGLTATCNAGGAGKWKPEHSRQLAGARVAVIPDNDEAGRDHAEHVAAAMSQYSPEVKIVPLEPSHRKGDVSDWLASGGAVDELARQIEGAPVWRPAFKPTFPFVWFGDEDSRPPLSWLVKGLVIEGGLAVVYGAPKSTKTFMVLDLALHIAHGRDWYGLRVQRGGVIYVCGEGEAGVRQRMKAWRQERDGDKGAPFALIPKAVNLFDGEDDVDRLIRDIEGAAIVMGEMPKLVIFDTFSRMIGEGDEDRAPDQNRMVARARRIQDATGVAVLYVHHSGKDEKRGTRGSNALPGAADVVICVKKDLESGHCEARVTDIKDGGEVGPFAYTLSQSTVGTDEEGEPIVSCVIDPAGASQGARRTALTPIEQRCYAALIALVGDARDMPGHWRNVPLQTWRDKFVASETGGDDAVKKRWQRSLEALENKGFVEVRYDTAYALEVDE